MPSMRRRAPWDALSGPEATAGSSGGAPLHDAFAPLHQRFTQASTSSSLGLSMTELPPPYSAVADEACGTHRLTSFSTDQSDAGQETTSISSMDLIASEDESLHQVGRISRIKRFRSTPQLPMISQVSDTDTHDEGHRTPRSHHPQSLHESMSSSTKACETMEPLEPLPRAFEMLLYSLRLFAVVPGLAGTLLLLHHAYSEAIQMHWLRTNYMFQRPSALEYVVCSLWSMSTAFHALSLMTLLLRRWLIYYTLLPSLIRLVAFQSICWSLVRVILHLFGPMQPLTPWVLISTFTSFFEIFARWLTSSINNKEDSIQGGGRPQYDLIETGVSDIDGVLSPDQDGFESTPQPWLWQLSRQDRFRMYREHSVRLVRAFMGGPEDMQTSDSECDSSDKTHMSSSDRLPEADSIFSLMEMERWRRRVHERRHWKHRFRVRRRRKAKRSRISAFFQNYHAAHIRSRRVFHWEVAMWRNVMPIGVLGYVSLWILLLEFTLTRYVQHT